MMKGNIDNVNQFVIIKKSCGEGGEYVSVGSI
jgi:hypothetical protein